MMVYIVSLNFELKYYTSSNENEENSEEAWEIFMTVLWKMFLVLTFWIVFYLLGEKLFIHLNLSF